MKLVQSIASAYYFFSGKDYKGRPWEDLEVKIFDGILLVNPAAQEDLDVVAKWVISWRVFERVYRKWQIETKNEKVKRGSGAWFRRQTISIDEMSLDLYLNYTIGWNIPYTPDLREAAKQDILIRRAADEAQFKTAAPLRRAWDRLGKAIDRTHQRFPQTFPSFKKERRIYESCDSKTARDQ